MKLLRRYQTTQAGSRATVTSKMEIFVIRAFLTIATEISILDVKGVPESDFHYRHFRFTELDLNHFEAKKKMDGFIEMGIY